MYVWKCGSTYGCIYAGMYVPMYGCITLFVPVNMYTTWSSILCRYADVKRKTRDELKEAS